MGHGGKFKETKVPTGSIVQCYAALGNMDDALKATEKAIDRIGEDPNDTEAWKTLGLYADRLKSRGVTLVTLVRTLLKSQEKM